MIMFRPPGLRAPSRQTRLNSGALSTGGLNQIMPGYPASQDQDDRQQRILAVTGGHGHRIMILAAAAQVSRNYLAALQHLASDLDQMGVEVIAVSGDPRERAEAFVRASLLSTLCFGNQHRC